MSYTKVTFWRQKGTDHGGSAQRKKHSTTAGNRESPGPTNSPTPPGGGYRATAYGANPRRESPRRLVTEGHLLLGSMHLHLIEVPDRRLTAGHLLLCSTHLHPPN